MHRDFWCVVGVEGLPWWEHQPSLLLNLKGAAQSSPFSPLPKQLTFYQEFMWEWPINQTSFKWQKIHFLLRHKPRFCPTCSSPKLVPVAEKKKKKLPPSDKQDHSFPEPRIYLPETWALFPLLMESRASCLRLPRARCLRPKRVIETEIALSQRCLALVLLYGRGVPSNPRLGLYQLEFNSLFFFSIFLFPFPSYPIFPSSVCLLGCGANLKSLICQASTSPASVFPSLRRDVPIASI